MLNLVMPFVRHAMQFGFGILTAKGWLTAEDAATALTNSEVAVGAIGSLVTFGWYVIDLVKKIKAAKAV